MKKRLLEESWEIAQIDPCKQVEPGAHNCLEWIKVPHMPMTVHDVLRKWGRIGDAWLPGEALACVWVARSDWLYRVSFSADPESIVSRLIFYGLDTIVDIYLNGKFISSSANMYLPFTADVSGKIRDKNELLLHFHTPFSDSSHPDIPCDYRGEWDRDYTVRRSNQNYKSYLGPQPYFSRVGIFAPVLFEQGENQGITRCNLHVDTDSDCTTGQVRLEIAGEFPPKARADITIADISGHVVAEKTKVLMGGQTEFTSHLSIKHPLLWWPRGYGEQNLYTLSLTVTTSAGITTVLERQIGFRSIRMISHLHFLVNNRPVRLYGANWVTPDWQSGVWNHERALRLLDMAEHANCNTLRIWGIVAPPDDRFYDEADRRGILIWQDFTDLIWNDTDENLRRMGTEVEHLIMRLRHHPSILLWCGGNEGALLHHFEQNPGQFPGRYLIEEHVAEICRRLDPERPYIPNSPYYGKSPNDPTAGDTHGYSRTRLVPGYERCNFVSEDTRIATPAVSSMTRFFRASDLWPADYLTIRRNGNELPWPAGWQKYTSEESWRKTGPTEKYYDACTIEELVYRLGMAAGEDYRWVIERQRRSVAKDGSGRRSCGGYLFWKLNDSWPQIYSGKIDYFLEPTIPYYLIRRAFSPVLLSIDVIETQAVWCVNDTPQEITGNLFIEVFSIKDNRVIAVETRNVEIAPDRAEQCLDLQCFSGIDRRAAISAQLVSHEGEVIAQNDCLLDIERNITFPKASLSIDAYPGGVEIRTDTYARCVILQGSGPAGETGWFFEDNYFSLLPGRSSVIRILGPISSGKITAVDIFSNNKATCEYIPGKDQR